MNKPNCCEKCSGILRDEYSFARDFGCQNVNCDCHKAPAVNKQVEEWLDELVRDITKVGFMPKSEARRRIKDLLHSQREADAREIEGMRRDDNSKPNQVYEHGVNVGYEDAIDDILTLLRNKE